jgi:hypothetical protein
MENTVIHVDAADEDMSTGARLIGEALRSAIDREQPFAVVAVMPVVAGHTGSGGRRTDGAGDRVRVLRSVRPGLTRWCRGLAFVADAAAQQVGAKAIEAGDRMWGCPTFTTDDADAALVWATAQLAGENR